MKRFFTAKTIVYCAVMYLLFILPYGYMAMNATTGSYETPLVKIFEIGFLVLSFPSSILLIPAYLAGGEYMIFFVICLPILNSLAWKWMIRKIGFNNKLHVTA